MAFLIIFTLFLILVPFCYAETLPKARCFKDQQLWIETEPKWPNLVQCAVSCVNINSGNRSLDNVLLSDLCPTNQSSYLQILADGNITVPASYQIPMPNVKLLTIGRAYFMNNPNIAYSVDLPSDFFQLMPKLEVVVLSGIGLTDSTLDALDNVKNTLKGLVVGPSPPHDKLLHTVKKFTNLVHLKFMRIENITSSIWSASKNSLMDLGISYGNLKITADLFQGLNKLESLLLNSNNITEIPPGTFDDLVNLTHLDMDYNKITRLPTGIFKNNGKLQTITFYKQKIENIDDIVKGKNVTLS